MWRPIWTLAHVGAPIETPMHPAKDAA
jgi:hypothetical protein